MSKACSCPVKSNHITRTPTLYRGLECLNFQKFFATRLFFLLKMYITVQLYVLDGKAICFSKSYRNLTFIPLRWRGTMKIFRLIFHCFLIEFSTFVYISFIQLFTYYMCIVPKLDLCFPGLFESCSLYAQTILVWRVPN